MEKAGRITNKRFYGNLVTAENRRSLMDKYIEDFVKTYYRVTEVKDHVPNHEVKEAAKIHAKTQVNKERKHIRAYVKGEMFYKYKGQLYIVMDNRTMNNKLIQINKTDEQSNDT